MAEAAPSHSGFPTDRTMAGLRLKLFFVSVISYLAFLLSLFVYLSSFWCLGWAVLRDCGISRVLSRIVFICGVCFVIICSSSLLLVPLDNCTSRLWDFMGSLTYLFVGSLRTCKTVQLEFTVRGRIYQDYGFPKRWPPECDIF